MVAIYGPVAPRVPHRERIDRGLVSVVFSKGLTTAGSAFSNEDSNDMKPLSVPLPPGGGASERELEAFVCDALSSCIMLERYPRCVIQVVVQIIHTDGSVFGTAVNCATLALMDAGIAMRGLPVACTCVAFGKSDENGTRHQNRDDSSIWIDPTAEEESAEGHAIAVLVTEVNSCENEADASSLILSSTFGAPITTSRLIQCINSTMEYNTAATTFMRMAIKQKVQKEVETLWS